MPKVRQGIVSRSARQLTTVCRTSDSWATPATTAGEFMRRLLEADYEICGDRCADFDEYWGLNNRFKLVKFAADSFPNACEESFRRLPKYIQIELNKYVYMTRRGNWMVIKPRRPWAGKERRCREYAMLQVEDGS